MSVGAVPQWFPEYDVRLGRPRAALPKRIARLRTRSGVYVRGYTRGIAAVNPNEEAREVALRRAMRLAVPHGGGELDANARSAGAGIRTRRVSGHLTLPPH